MTADNVDDAAAAGVQCSTCQSTLIDDNRAEEDENLSGDMTRKKQTQPMQRKSKSYVSCGVLAAYKPSARRKQLASAHRSIVRLLLATVIFLAVAFVRLLFYETIVLLCIGFVSLSPPRTDVIIECSSVCDVGFYTAHCLSRSDICYLLSCTMFEL